MKCRTAGRSGQPSLSWSLRLRIAKGVARGLAHIHDCSPRKFVHGAVKPSNILLDQDFTPYLADFALHRLLSLAADPSTTATSTTSGLFPSSSSSKLLASFDRPNPYRAPEARPAAGAPAGRPTQKSDVYSFGVVLLEMLTGRSPDMSPAAASTSSELVAELVRWVRRAFKEARPVAEIADVAVVREAQAKKEVVAAFHVALACAETEPEARPRMKTVVESLERIG